MIASTNRAASNGLFYNHKSMNIKKNAVVLDSAKKQISYIANGVNIDHIPQGHALRIANALNLFDSSRRIQVGLNLSSKRLGYKDLIKIENRILTIDEIDIISLFCVGATMSVIKDYEITEKITLQPAREINNIISCPNKRCVSKEYTSKFKTSINRQKQICVKCHYCEQVFSLDGCAISCRK